MLSILIPTYNHSVFSLVKELQHQASTNNISYEIIVMDDASRDKKIIDENLQVNNIDNCSYLVQSENQGRTATRQHLALRARFDNLLFLDADVIPKYPDFIQRFQYHEQEWDIQFGGIAYKPEAPPTSETLRWKYGKARETLSVSERKNDPYQTINSGAFLIKKALFLEINEQLKFNMYGLDNLFKQLLEKKNAKVVHLDNPVFHLGLENSVTFIKKAKEAVKTTVDLEQEGLIENNRRPLQKAYIKLKKFGLLRTFITIAKQFNKRILRNLNSKNPSLLLFDLYRLHYYSELKSQKNA
tara:strand:- start:1028 stop:1924 length:897 start_codon:yes stop_codon:yes gene_type:complete